MLIYNSEKILKLENIIKNNSDVLLPFEDKTLDFFSAIYLELGKKKEIKEFPELVSLKFWLRPGSLIKIIEENKSETKKRLRLGTVFHISPSNTPLNFFYSLFYGLISGNLNIVRLPSKNYESLIIFFECFSKVINKTKFKKIKKNIFFVKYDKNSQYTKFLSKFSDLRIIWGGDETINAVREIPLKPKSREITFPDRMSIALINTKEYEKLNKSQKNDLTKKFYGDLFFVDQNACTSPQIIMWVNGFSVKTRDHFWNKIEIYAKKKYELPEIASSDKLVKFYSDLKNFDISRKTNLKSLCSRIVIKKLPNEMTNLRGKWGYFYEFNLKNLNNLSNVLNSKFQTCVYFGFSSDVIFDKIKNNRENAIDRIVPVGQAHNFDGKWDGYDLFKSMTRVINCN